MYELAAVTQWELHSGASVGYSDHSWAQHQVLRPHGVVTLSSQGLSGSLSTEFIVIPCSLSHKMISQMHGKSSLETCSFTRVPEQAGASLPRAAPPEDTWRMRFQEERGAISFGRRWTKQRSPPGRTSGSHSATLGLETVDATVGKAKGPGTWHCNRV